jgi:hypothetical protein
MYQTNAAAAIKSFYKLSWYCCTCIALRVLRFATQFVTLLAAHTAFVTAAIVSFTPLRSLLPSLRFITPRSQLSFATRLGSPFPALKLNTGLTQAFSQARPTILTGFHSASLRHTFTSVAFSPPAAHNLACLAACHGCGFVIVFVPKRLTSTKTKTYAKPLRLTVAVYRRCTAF